MQLHSLTIYLISKLKTGTGIYVM